MKASIILDRYKCMLTYWPDKRHRLLSLLSKYYNGDTQKITCTVKIISVYLNVKVEKYEHYH